MSRQALWPSAEAIQLLPTPGRAADQQVGVLVDPAALDELGEQRAGKGNVDVDALTWINAARLRREIFGIGGGPVGRSGKTAPPTDMMEDQPCS